MAQGIALASSMSPIDAQRLAHLLKAGNISCLISDNEPAALHGPSGATTTVRIVVDKDDYSRARQILEASEITDWSETELES